MRLFLAVEVDREVRAAVARLLGEVQAALDRVERGASRGVKWSEPDRMHLTLHFLGEVSGHVVERLEQVLAPPLSTPAFLVEFGGIGAFPPGRGAPRVLWLGCTGGASDLQRAHRELADRLAAVPVAVDARPFSPHLTLGRFRDPGSPRVRTAWEQAAEPRVGACRVDAVTLFESRLSSAGPHYTTRLRIPLGS